MSVRLIKDIGPELNDWFLPSKDELDEMYTNLYLFGVGGFHTGQYWSSSEASPVAAWLQNMLTGGQGATTKDIITINVRACRSFLAGVGAYSLRDVGPGGGWIFHIAGGTTYYEAAPIDQSAGYIWSNIIAILIGTTGTAIGTGENNTDDIITQPGHITSSALLCRNYIL